MSVSHDELFAKYVEELRAAKVRVEGWWNALIGFQAVDMEDPTEALREVKNRWPVGPAAHPLVIGVFRKYYLACDALNRDIAAAGSGEDDVDPLIFLTEWLLDGQNDELAEFLAVLPYWPIGMDLQGNTI
jgi:hypothetical protein